MMKEQTKNMQNTIEKNESQVISYVTTIINELSIVTFIMICIVIAIAVWMSNHITKKIKNLLDGTQKFTQHELDYKIDITSNDEIGHLEKSFNNMAYEVQKLLSEQKELNEHLEEKVEEKTVELKDINKNLEQRVQTQLNINRQKDIQLLEQSKMASLGEMITMIVHQWKQPLNAINIVNSGMKLRIMLDKLTHEDINHDINVIEKQVKLMASTMDDFRNFFKQTKRIEYSVAEDIERAIDLVGDIYSSKDVRINFKSKSAAKTLGYPNDLIQVLINILNNARDIIVDNKLVSHDIQLTVDCDEKYVYVSIQDYAGGIPDDTIEHIFDPYFTTKDEDKGTGLGLYMSKAILEKVDATISVTNKKTVIDDKEYLGACFIIALLKVKEDKKESKKEETK